MKVFDAPLRAWKLHTYNNHDFFYLRVKWRRAFHSCVHSEYFYVICDDPGIFGRFARGEPWLHDYRGVFIVTCPIFSYLKGSRSYYYSVANAFTSSIEVVYPHDNQLDLLLNSSAYTICNGLIIELAKMRAGAPAQLGLERIRREFDDYHAIPEHYMDLYISHVYPQVADHPYLYYCTPGCPVTEYLNDTYNPHDQHTNQYTDAMNRICYRTSQQIMRFSVQPRFSENDTLDRPVDKHMIDFVSLVRGIARRRAVYRWYLRNRYEIYARYLEFNKHTTITQFLLKRIFALYNRTPCRRLFQVFKDIIGFMNPRPFWIHRSIIMGIIRNPDEWQPAVPLGFIKYCKEITFTRVTFRIFTMDLHVRERVSEIFADYIAAVGDDPIKIRIRLWDILGMTPHGQRVRAYYEARIASRLCAIGAGRGPAFWEPMRSWFEANRYALIA